jgi:hypothetical protein
LLATHPAGSNIARPATPTARPDGLQPPSLDWVSLREQGWVSFDERQSLSETDPQLSVELDLLVDPLTRGDPQSPLRWTCKSTSHLAQELSLHGHPISARAVAQLLNVAGYSLQGNRKTLEGAAHPDRNAQFEHINVKVKRFQQRGQPVISVDTKKKELVGPYKNYGREWQRKGEPERVDVHDFPDPELGKVIPYGVFDMSRNEGWVSVGIDHDTAQFAVQAIGRWWHKMGGNRYPHASALLITADGGGSNGSRCRLWKVALQRPWRRASGCPSMCATSRREPANGTRSSIACSLTSPRTGEVGLW